MPGGEISNGNPPSVPPSVGPNDYTAGDANGFVVDQTETFSRGLPWLAPSPWDGWPAEWALPNWGAGPGFGKLVDTAWNALDLNSSVIASMPVYRMTSGQIVEAPSWMVNPDPTIYTSWYEFAKQLFWDFMLGEAFVMPFEYYADGYPRTMRVICPAYVKVEMDGPYRRYWIGKREVTDEILHIRYQSSTNNPHGVGPLEAAGARMVTLGVLARQVDEVIATGGVPRYTLDVERQLTKAQADEVFEQWMASRAGSIGRPGLLSGGITLNAHQQMSPKDLALLELTQWNDSRIAIALGVPPFLLGLPSGGDSMTYSNVSSLFDFHDRASIRPKVTAVMSALSNWAMPRGTSAELNRDEYSRPALNERADAYVKLVGIGALSGEEVARMERFNSVASAAALTGADSGTN
jgi:HK97 family phage portal protein